MKAYRFTNQENTWWIEYRTDGMENSEFEKVVNIKTSNTAKKGLELTDEMIGIKLPNHLGQEVTQIGLEALATANSLRLEKRYESKVPAWLRKSASALISEFKFLDSKNAALSVDVVGVIDDQANTIALTVPAATVVTALVASFTTAFGVTAVAIGATPQVSGTTANNFSAPKSYVVTAEDGTTTKTYVVTVTVAS